ncbi:MAG: hypothetical protein P4L59_16350 [Desulfosporosinus sp.]|nr:hypothetical protein [Desulfosporosinus sp.]
MAYPTDQFQIVPTITFGGVGFYIAMRDWVNMVDDLAWRSAILADPKLEHKKRVAAFVPSRARIEGSCNSCTHGRPPFYAKGAIVSTFP